jgi:hypothetical protein
VVVIPQRRGGLVVRVVVGAMTAGCDKLIGCAVVDGCLQTAVSMQDRGIGVDGLVELGNIGVPAGGSPLIIFTSMGVPFFVTIVGPR